MLLYHGSNIAITEPRLIIQTRGLDFGMGFYLTSNEEQARTFSEIIVRRRECGIATVSVYEFDMDYAVENFKVKKFEKADSEWLRFVIDNRMKTYQGINYDIVIGAVANDKVMPTIQAFLGGFFNEDAAILTLKTAKLVDQICLKSNDVISRLRFIKAYTGRDIDV